MKTYTINQGLDLVTGQQYVALLLQCQNQADLDLAVQQLQVTKANVKLVQFDSFTTTHWVWLLSAPFDNQDDAQMQIALQLLKVLGQSDYVQALHSDLMVAGRVLGDSLSDVFSADTFTVHAGSDTTCDYMATPNSSHANQMVSIDVEMLGLVFDCWSVKQTYRLLSTVMEKLYLHHDAVKSIKTAGKRG